MEKQIEIEHRNVDGRIESKIKVPDGIVVVEG